MWCRRFRPCLASHVSNCIVEFRPSPRNPEDGVVVERLIILLALTAVALAVALLLQRRRPDPPTAPSYRAPRQLDRDDFGGRDKPVIVVVFASDTCSTCPAVWNTVRQFESDVVAVHRTTVQDDSGLHRRYRIDGVPTTVIANHEGVVVEAFFGPVQSDDLANALTDGASDAG